MKTSTRSLTNARAAASKHRWQSSRYRVSTGAPPPAQKQPRLLWPRLCEIASLKNLHNQPRGFSNENSQNMAMMTGVLLNGPFKRQTRFFFYHHYSIYYTGSVWPTRCAECPTAGDRPSSARKLARYAYLAQLLAKHATIWSYVTDIINQTSSAC